MLIRLGILSLAGLVVLGQASTEALLPTVSLDLEERVLIDSNVLRLSDRDLNQLDSDPTFQDDVDGEAGLKVEHRVGLDLDWRLASKSGLVDWLQQGVGGRSGRGRLRLNLDGKWCGYEASSSKAYNSHAIGLDWRPRAGWGAQVSWRFLDNFYLRQYTDRDTDAVRGATFDSDLLKYALRFRLPDWRWFSRVGVELDMTQDFTSYNAWFTEYDTEAWSLGMRVGANLPFGFDMKLGYAFASTDNVGYVAGSSVGLQAGSDDEGGDGSHEEDQYRFNLGRNFRLLDYRLTLDLDGLIRDRFYTSSLGELADPFHYARHDRRQLWTLRASLYLPYELRLLTFVERELRSSEAAYGEIDSYKNYNLTRFGMGLRWSVDLR